VPSEYDWAVRRSFLMIDGHANPMFRKWKLWSVRSSAMAPVTKRCTQGSTNSSVVWLEKRRYHRQASCLFPVWVSRWRWSLDSILALRDAHALGAEASLTMSPSRAPPGKLPHSILLLLSVWHYR
jgi:hypothetical protein